MSEYQFVIFQAVDGPLDDKQLQYARRQSTRAETSRWSLSCEYNYSEFGGDVDGLLRHGYDVYLEYANYGIRQIKLRFPRGTPVAEHVWSKYVDGDRLHWTLDGKDKGSGGILTLCPFNEAGELEELQDPRQYLDAVVRVRDRLMSGDLRALYLLWLCAANDDNHDPEELIEPPVPHGLSDFAAECGELLEFFGLDPLLLVAAGEDVDAAPAAQSEDHAAPWVQSLDEPTAKELLLRLLVGDTAGEKARLLAESRDAQVPDGWPTSDKRRSLEELTQRASELRDEKAAKQARAQQAKAQREADKAARERTERMKQMLKDPDKWLREAERLVDARGTANYAAAADILHDLREAVGGDEGDTLARRHAARLVKKHPTLSQLKSSLRKRGLFELKSQ